MKIHIVQKGDTLWAIAEKYDVQFEDLLGANPQISSPEMIMPGMKVKIPGEKKSVKLKEQQGQKNMRVEQQLGYNPPQPNQRPMQDDMIDDNQRAPYVNNMMPTYPLEKDANMMTELSTKETEQHVEKKDYTNDFGMCQDEVRGYNTPPYRQQRKMVEQNVPLNKRYSSSLHHPHYPLQPYPYGRGRFPMPSQIPMQPTQLSTSHQLYCHDCLKQMTRQNEEYATGKNNPFISNNQKISQYNNPQR